MNVIIAGTRSCENYDLLIESINESAFDFDCVLSGGAQGVDKMAERFAIENDIPLTVIMADWDKNGRGAGPIRNAELIKRCGSNGALILLWDGKSKGSWDILGKAFSANLQIFVKTIR